MQLVTEKCEEAMHLYATTLHLCPGCVCRYMISHRGFATMPRMGVPVGSVSECAVLTVPNQGSCTQQSDLASQSPLVFWC